ncbi:MAG: CatB-related O-acetyltransferase [Paludibacteraceae bacterium]|nr:CatB-related O-acetyltransferase [Paludibacteraceae bacterium]
MERMKYFFLGKKINHKIKNLCRRILISFVPEARILFQPEISVLYDKSINFDFIRSKIVDSEFGENTKLCHPYRVNDSKIGDYTYLSLNSYVSLTTIGKFCSIGPNLVCGWGIHPTNGISTSPMFYSNMKQNGMSFSPLNKIEERKPIVIGNDVFIGANVTILDGVIIGDGAIIGAGAVVSKDIPPYAIAIGCPIKIVKYRFDNEKINDFQKIKWWNFSNDDLKDVEALFFDVNKFIQKYVG